MSEWERRIFKKKPVQKIPKYFVQFFEIFGRDDAVGVEVEDVKEEVTELVLLEIRDLVSSRLNSVQLSHVVAEAAVDPGSWE